MDREIDVVYTWVDDANPNFRTEMRTCLAGSLPPRNSLRSGLFRDNGELRFSLRSLEKFAPWIRKVFIVTNGEPPTWLNAADDRVSVITHDLIFTEKSDLPTFNSSAIEANLHRIPGLSRRFLYFNDDVFLGRPVFVEDFVTPSGGQYLYVDHALHSGWIPDEFVVDVSAQSYTRSLVEGMCDHSISRLLPAHVPHFFDREILFRLEELLSEQFRETSSRRFRSPNDVLIPILYSLYVSEVLGHEDGHQCRFLAPPQCFLPFGWRYDQLRLDFRNDQLRRDTVGKEQLEKLSGLHDYAMIVLNEQTWMMIRSLCALRVFQPKFFSINDRLGEVSSQHPSFICLRSLLRSYFPLRSSFESSRD
jgi:hypothetical protein